LLESDELLLSSSFVLQESVIYDIDLRAVHYIRRPGDRIILALSEGVSFEEVLKIAKMYGITDSQLGELLGFLNSIGALQRRKRMFLQQVKAARLQTLHLLLGTYYPPLAWRQRATPGNTIVSILRATWPVSAAAILVGVLSAASGLMPAQSVLSIGLFGVMLFIGSLFMHEMTHISIANSLSAMPRLLRAGMRLGVIHRKLPPDAEARSSLLGPTIGSGICLLVALVSIKLGWHGYALTAVIVASFHSLALLPWYGDGASLHKALRTKTKEKYEEHS
jgi:hypothetical protein